MSDFFHIFGPTFAKYLFPCKCDFKGHEEFLDSYYGRLQKWHPFFTCTVSTL